MISYAITDPSTLNFNNLNSNIKQFASKADMIVYRDKSTNIYNQNSFKFLKETKKYTFSKVLLHRDYILADRLNADGVHLTSTQFDDIQKAKALGLFVIISTHSLEEVLKAQKLGSDMVTFSPIFLTPHKGEPKGVEELKRVISIVSIPIIALGGIVTQNQIELCKRVGAYGFASIRLFS